MPTEAPSRIVEETDPFRLSVADAYLSYCQAAEVTSDRGASQLDGWFPVTPADVERFARDPSMTLSLFKIEFQWEGVFACVDLLLSNSLGHLPVIGLRLNLDGVVLPEYLEAAPPGFRASLVQAARGCLEASLRAGRREGVVQSAVPEEIAAYANNYERLLPALTPYPVLAHHVKRYLLAQQFAAGRRVLDAGCGIGYGSRLLAQRAGSVAGLDLSATALQFAERTYAAENVTFTQGSVTSLPFEDDSFDLAVCFEVVEHVSAADQCRLIAEVDRVLGPEGVFVTSTPNRLWEQALSGRNPHHLTLLSLDELTAWLGERFEHVALFGQRFSTERALAGCNRTLPGTRPDDHTYIAVAARGASGRLTRLTG